MTNCIHAVQPSRCQERAAITEQPHRAREGVANRAVQLWVMTVVLLLVFGICADRLTAWPIRTDELFSISNMGGFHPPFSPIQIVESVVTYSPDHAPLYFLLGAGWASLVGWSDFALRSSSLLTAVLMIAWLYRLGAVIFGRRAGLIAAAMMGASAYLVLHYHDFRMYPMLLLLAVIHCWLYWRLLYGKAPVVTSWVCFAAAAAALVYTHSTALILFAGLGLFHVIVARRSRTWIGIAAGWAIAALAYLPYLPTLIAGVQDAAATLSDKSAPASIAELTHAFLILLANGAVWLLILLLGLLILAIFRQRDGALLRYSVMPIGMLATFIMLNEVFGFIPLSRMRYFIIMWFPFLLLFARAISQMPRWTGLAAMLLFLWGAAGFHYYRASEILPYIGGMTKIRDYPQLQNYVPQLRDKVSAQDFILGFTWDDYVNYDHKHGQSAADFYTQAHLGIDGAFVRSRAIGAWLVDEMGRLIDGHPYLLFAYERGNEPDGLLGAIYFMESRYRSCDVLVDNDQLFVQRYVDRMLDCDHVYAPITYDIGISVVDRAARYDPVSERLSVLTGWEVPDQDLLYHYSVSFQVLTPDWRNVRQHDRNLFDNLLKWSAIELSTAGLPPGEYRLAIVLYHSQNGERLGGIDQSTGESGSILPIHFFTVE